jgi:hypothetical protein
MSPQAMSLNPFIDGSVRRACVKRDEGAITHTSGNVRNTAKIENACRVAAEAL